MMDVSLAEHPKINQLPGDGSLPDPHWLFGYLGFYQFKLKQNQRIMRTQYRYSTIFHDCINSANIKVFPFSLHLRSKFLSRLQEFKLQTMKTLFLAALHLLFFIYRLDGQAVQTPATPPILQLSEILFDPYTGGKDFVELYNPGADAIQLLGISLYNRFKSGYSTARRTISKPYLLEPGACVAISPDTLDLRRRYPIGPEARLFQHSLPSLDSDRGNITLLREDTLLDALDYDAAMHHPLLRNPGGYSLERQSVRLPTSDSGNWATCPAGARPGTYHPLPGWSAPGALVQPPHFELANVRFSPEGGYLPQELCVLYSAAVPGILVNMRIFDAAGRQVCPLQANALLDSSGTFCWDGREAGGKAAPPGIYFVWIESKHPFRLLGFRVLPFVLVEKR